MLESGRRTAQVIVLLLISFVHANLSSENHVGLDVDAGSVETGVDSALDPLQNEQDLSDYYSNALNIFEKMSTTVDDDNICKKEDVCQDTAPDALSSNEEKLENNVTFAENATDASVTPKKVECSAEVLDSSSEESENPSLKIVDSQQLSSYLTHNPNITSRSTAAPCVLVYFFASWCHHSARAAPHMNALPRAFPHIPMLATDSMKHHSVNTQHGIMAVPALMLFHNGRPVSRFNDSEYNLSTFASFVTRNTGIDPACQLNVTSEDYVGPLTTFAELEMDYILLLAWTFILFASLYFVAKTTLWRTALERLFRRRQHEAAHEHVD